MSLDPAAIFQRYRHDRRQQPIEGFDLEVLPYLSRYTARTPGAQGFVAFADLPPGRAAEIVDEQIRHFAALGQRFEWKLHEFDRPATLGALLAARGFAAAEPEAFMVQSTAAWSRATRPPEDVRIEIVADEGGLRDIVAIQAALYPDTFDWLFRNYARVLRNAPERVALYCACSGGRPVATGWIDFPPGSEFAELHGGAVLPEHRGRGIFSALVDRRMRAAQARGYAFVAVDAAPMSRPILLRQGFTPICLTLPLRQSKS